MTRLGMDPNLRILLVQTAEAGWRVEFFAGEDACGVCRAQAGQKFDPSEAPVIPVAECENDICRCDYIPDPN